MSNLPHFRLHLDIIFSNPGGIRFGSAEIYDVIENCFVPSASVPAAHTIVDSLAIGQSIDGGTDERVVLFVQLPQGETLSPDLEKRLKAEIRARRSPRHVPSKVTIWLVDSDPS